MADRICVTSLMRSRITAAGVPRQRRGREFTGSGRAPGQRQQRALELLARGRLPGPLLASDAPQVHDAIQPNPAKMLSPDAYGKRESPLSALFTRCIIIARTAKRAGPKRKPTWWKTSILRESSF